MNKKMTARTGNDAPAYSHSLDHCLEFFSKGGSIRGKQTYYKNKKEDVVQLFKNAWYANSEIAMKLLFWCRDARGGAGNRQIFRDCIKWLSDIDSEWVKTNIHLIPHYGRWDDLVALYDTDCEKEALELWSDALTADDPNITPLAAKWADRQDAKLRSFMGLGPKAFRKMVSKKTGWVVEKSMCQGYWENINFDKVPSVAGARYRNAFKKHQEARYNEWCANSKNVKASVLFPHDLIRMVNATIDQDKNFETLVENMFDNIPNYITNPKIRSLAICDFSGSMCTEVSGSVSALDVSLGLGLYCGDRLGKNNPFYRKLIPFSDDASLVTWQRKSVLDAIRSIPDGYCGSTNIEAALNVLLDSATMWNVKPKDMVNTLIILSDMQFNQAVTGADVNVIENCIKRWEDAGYERPAIVYWNLCAYDNQPATKLSKNVAMVSGFSPSILKTVLNNEDIDPMKVMFETIKKYEIVVP